MSYSSRVYRQRNPNTHDESKQKSFFSGSKKEKNKEGDEKLSVNKLGDAYEQEADAVANTVVNQPAATPHVSKKEISSVQRLATSKDDEKMSTTDERMKQDKEIQEKPIQRAEAIPEKEEDKVQKMDEPQKEEEKVQKAAEPKEEEDKVQKMDEPKKEEENKVQKMDEPERKDEPEKEEKESTTPVQPKLNDSTGTPGTSKVGYLKQSKGKGNRLPKQTLNEMNSHFNVDFSQVRIHNDRDAAKVSKDLNAQAFTHGKDVYFNEGKFDPETASGKFLLAHELTHVVQQDQGGLQKPINRKHSQTSVNKEQNTNATGAMSDASHDKPITAVQLIFKNEMAPNESERRKFISWSGGKIHDVVSSSGEVRSFNGPDLIIVTVHSVVPDKQSKHDDKNNGEVEVAKYLELNAIPEFKGATGMSEGEFAREVNEYHTALASYFQKMS